MDKFHQNMLSGFLMTYENTPNVNLSHTIAPPENIFEKTALRTVGPVRNAILSTNAKREQLLRNYNLALFEHGIGMTRQQLKTKDQIDMRSLFERNENDHTGIPKLTAPTNRQAFLKQNDWYACIPCLSEAVIRINIGRYLYYKITDIQTENKCYTVYLHDYIAYPGNFSNGVYGTADFDFNAPDNQVQTKRHDDIMTFSDLYRLISYDDMKWSQSEQKLWQDVILEFADKTIEKLHNNGTDQFQELCKVFLSVITIMNQHLANNKTSRPKKKPINNNNIQIDTSNVSHPEKLVRTVGLISIKSEKPPKLPSEKTIIHYHLESWKTRGHIRTLKSGKQVYVKESVHRRHCLSQSDDKPPQNVIRFKKL